MKNLTENITDERFFHYFREICNIPHVSFHTDKIRDYIEHFAADHNLRYAKDDYSNIVIYKDGSAGYEDHDAVVLQGHLDMVGASKEEFDFINKPVTIDEELLGQGIVKAKGTTLGADDGIAVAYILAILEDDSLCHPPIEALLTTNEEVGLLGADGFDCSLLSGTTVINIDSEDEGVFLMGSAGGVRCDITIPMQWISKSGDNVTIRVTGLTGGHSGDKIGTGRPSANSLMGRVLNEILQECTGSIVYIKGGSVDNAIANECEAELITDEYDKIAKLCNSVEKDLRQEYFGIDENISVFVGLNGKADKKVLDTDSQKRAVTALCLAPQGVIARSGDDNKMVNTSLNLGIVKLTDDLKMGYSVRSVYESAKNGLTEKLRLLALMLGGTTVCSGNYPAWQYEPESRVRELAGNVYRKLTGKEPVFKTIHAGLECGLFYNRMNKPDIVSYGPDIYDIHTFEERMDIASAKRVYELTVELLRNM